MGRAATGKAPKSALRPAKIGPAKIRPGQADLRPGSNIAHAFWGPSVPRKGRFAAGCALSGLQLLCAGYLKAVWPDCLGAFLRSGRPRGRENLVKCGRVRPPRLSRAPGAGQTSNLRSRIPEFLTFSWGFLCFSFVFVLLRPGCQVLCSCLVFKETSVHRCSWVDTGIFGHTRVGRGKTG